MQYTIIKDTPVEESVLLINDSYNCMDICSYVMPVPEVHAPDYEVVKTEVHIDEPIEMVYKV